MSIYPAIVIVAYNRADLLSRLLFMLLSAKYPVGSSVALVISVDGGGLTEVEVVRIANDFCWPFGDKEVISHSRNLGLREHILSCGDLTHKYEAIIMLEDDLIVSPCFYQFAVSGLNSSSLLNDAVAGLSLYNYRVNETSLVRFHPIEDEFDNYYLQVPSSWGQLWTTNQWLGFRDWYRENKDIDFAQVFRNRVMAAWGQKNNSSWKRYFAAYMILENKYMLFPRRSYTDNSGDEGENHTGEIFHRTPLVLSDGGVFQFSKLEESLAVYDQNFELDPRILRRLYPNLDIASFCVYLNDSELILENAPPYVLTRSKVRCVKSWGAVYYPIELNILLNVPGNEISFVASNNIRKTVCTYSLLTNEKIFGLKDCVIFFLRKLYERIQKLLIR